jgi:hypothetical protein
VDIESVRWNERWKSYASLADNASLALLGGSIAKAFSDSGPDKWTYGGVFFAVALLWIAWHIRGLIEPEE